jgi:hypothetical protein
MSGKRPTARSLEYFRKLGFTCEIVERFVYTHRKDFLSCIDIMVMKEGHKKMIGIQCFSTAWKEHERKILEEFPEGAKFWLGLKYTDFWFVGWRRLKLKRGGKAVRWKPRFGKVKLTKKGKLKLIEKEFKI